MYRIIEAEALPGYRLRLRFEDGVQGEVDLSDMPREGVFSAWQDPAAFQRVSIDSETGTVTWPGGIDLCPHTLHDDVASRCADGASVS
jgi:hypothetical protein